MFQFSQILRYVDRNWYIGKEINANNMVNFSSQRMDTSGDICRSLKGGGYSFDSLSIFPVTPAALRTVVIFIHTCK